MNQDELMKELIFKRAEKELKEMSFLRMRTSSIAEHAYAGLHSIMKEAGILEEFEKRIAKSKEIPSLNTKISYLYRDASNYKRHHEIIVSGMLTQKDIAEILDALNEGEYFIPEQIGFPAERFSDTTEDDHCWMELEKDSFEFTFFKPTIDMSAKEVVEQFRKAKDHWDVLRYAVIG